MDKASSNKGSVWNNKDFIWLMSGQTVSIFGSAVSKLALPWLILEITGSALQMGVIIAIGILPYIILSLPAGVWADRYDRKKLMLFSNMGSLLCICLIPMSDMITGSLPLVLIYIVRIGMSFCEAVFDSSYGACLPNLVPKEQLKQGNSLMQTGAAISMILGPSIGGIAVVSFGAANTLFIDAFSYLFSALSLFFVMKNMSNMERSKKAAMGTDILEGLRYVWRHQTIRALSVLTLLANLSNAAISVVLLYRLNVELGVSAGASGFVISGISIGALAASLLSTILGEKIKTDKVIYLSLLIQIIPPVIMMVTSHVLLLVISTFLIGFAGVLWNIHSVSLRQTIIPNHMLGRTGASINLLAKGCMPLGYSLGGALAEAFGAVLVFGLSGAIRGTNVLIALKLLANNQPETCEKDYKDEDII